MHGITHRRTGQLEYAFRSDLKEFVKYVIQDMISAAGLFYKITSFNETTFARSSPPDIWVLESGETMKIPVAFLEVKTLKEGISHTN